MVVIELTVQLVPVLSLNVLNGVRYFLAEKLHVIPRNNTFSEVLRTLLSNSV